MKAKAKEKEAKAEGKGKVAGKGKQAAGAPETEEVKKKKDLEDEGEDDDAIEEEDEKKKTKKKTQSTPKIVRKPRKKPPPIDPAVKATEEYQLRLKEDQAYAPLLTQNKLAVRKMVRQQIKAEKQVRKHVFETSKRAWEEQIRLQLQHFLLLASERNKVQDLRNEEKKAKQKSLGAYWARFHGEEKAEKDRVQGLKHQAWLKREEVMSLSRTEYLRALSEECYRWRDSPEELKYYRYDEPDKTDVLSEAIYSNHAHIVTPQNFKTTLKKFKDMVADKLAQRERELKEEEEEALL